MFSLQLNSISISRCSENKSISVFMVYVINLLFIDKFVILIRTISNVSGCLAVVKRELSEALVVAAQSGGDNPLHPSCCIKQTLRSEGLPVWVCPQSTRSSQAGEGVSLSVCLQVMASTRHAALLLSVFTLREATIHNRFK